MIVQMKAAQPRKGIGIAAGPNHHDKGKLLAMATTNLSQNRALERIRQHRHAVFVLALQRAKKSVVAQIRAQGLKPQHFSAREVTLMAEAELERNRDRLVPEAEHVINTWPGFARWRLPPGHEVFAKSTEIEHLPNADSAIAGEIASG
jgi:hypothetical protein